MSVKKLFVIWYKYVIALNTFSTTLIAFNNFKHSPNNALDCLIYKFRSKKAAIKYKSSCLPGRHLPSKCHGVSMTCTSREIWGHARSPIKLHIWYILLWFHATVFVQYWSPVINDSKLFKTFFLLCLTLRDSIPSITFRCLNLYSWQYLRVLPVYSFRTLDTVPR
jgi:hypothetical protein